MSKVYIYTFRRYVKRIMKNRFSIQNQGLDFADIETILAFTFKGFEFK